MSITYGAHSLSFGDGVELADGDVMCVRFDGFGRAAAQSPAHPRPRSNSPVTVRNRSLESFTMTKPRVAFLGLGTMGSGMARRLLGAGFPLTVYNRSAGKAAPALRRRRDSGARHPARRRPRAGIVISMVADDNASRGLWLGENGALAAPRRARCSSSRAPSPSAGFGNSPPHAAGHGCELLDAPVTGSRPQAAAGEL